MSARSHRKRFLVLLFVAVAGFAAWMGLAPRADPIVGNWVTPGFTNGLGILQIKNDGTISVGRGKLHRPDFQGSWKRVEAGTLYFWEPEDPFQNPFVTHYVVAEDPRLVTHARPVEVPADASAYLITYGGDPVLSEKPDQEVFFLHRNRLRWHRAEISDLQRFSWVDEAVSNVRSWWKER